MRFEVAKFTVLGRNPGDVAVMAVVYDQENEMAMVPMVVFQGGKLLVADVPACSFGPREEYEKNIDEIAAQIKEMGVPKREDSSFDDGREAEEFLFTDLERLNVKPFDKDLVLTKLDQAAADCFQPAKDYGWLSPPRGWQREPKFL